MSGNRNGNGKHQPIDLVDLEIAEDDLDVDRVLWCVYHEGEKNELNSQGMEAQEVSWIQPRDRDVVVITGSGDLYGTARAPDDAAFLYRQGARSVRIVQVPTMRNSTLQTLLVNQVWSVDQLYTLARAAPAIAYASPPPEPAYDEKGRINWTRLSDEDMGMRRASAIKPKRIEWLMPDRIPARAYTLIAGEGKQGKSQLTMAMAALLSTGGDWWDGSGKATQGHALILSAEDDAERAIRPRLEALGADLDLVTILEARYKVPSDDGKEPLVAFTEMSDLEYWREVFRRVKDPVAIFIDPLPSYIGRSVNDRKNSEVRAVLGPFIALAVEFGMTVIGVTHLGKSVDPTRSIANRVLDSIAYTNLARAVHFVAKDPEDHDRKFFMPGPCNYAPGGLESLAFRLVEKSITTDQGEAIAVAVAAFEPNTVALDPQDVVSVVKSRRGPASKIRVELAIWLYDKLKDGIPVAAGELYDMAALYFADRDPNPLGVQEPPHGYWSNSRNLRRAADVDLPELPYPRAGKCIEKYQDPGQKNRGYWRLVSNKERKGEPLTLPLSSEET